MKEMSDVPRRAAHEGGHGLVACLFGLPVTRISVQVGDNISAAMSCDLSGASRAVKLWVYLAGWAGNAYRISQQTRSKSFDVENYIKHLRRSKQGAGSAFGVLIFGESDMALAMLANPIKALFPRSTLIEIGRFIHEHRVKFFLIMDALETQYSIDGTSVRRMCRGEPMTDADRTRSRNADLEYWSH